MKGDWWQEERSEECGVEEEEHEEQEFDTAQVEQQVWTAVRRQRLDG